VQEAVSDFDEVPQYTNVFLGLLGSFVLMAQNTNEGPHRLIAGVNERVSACH
jgi:hypothetical protein